MRIEYSPIVGLQKRKEIIQAFEAVDEEIFNGIAG